MSKLILLVTGILFIALGLGVIYNEYSFRRRAVIVRSNARSDIALSNRVWQLSFTCPFTRLSRQMTVPRGLIRFARYPPDHVILVYVSPQPPHRYRANSPMYFLGGLLIVCTSVFCLLILVFR
jgi:hypothetical protein